jgi:ElaB/YqjD/DUF883 family membrane-anchored ribosome-binding protein
MSYDETAKSAVQGAIGQGRNAAEKASQTVQDGYKAAQEYAEDKGLDIGDFVRREPWLAITAAFAIGYVVAQMIRRVS